VGVRYKNFVLLIASIFFYSWGAPKFIFVILGTTILDFYVVKMMGESQNQVKRKLLLFLSIIANIGLLFYFKYANFFIDNINVALSNLNIQPLSWTHLILPIGISFYTFETITYVIDVYRKVHRPLTNFWDYQLYIIMFPKLIAGPIVRYIDIADQIKNRFVTDNIDARLTGFYRFSIGLGKKVIIANQLGIFADQIFMSDYTLLDSRLAWIAIIGFAFQLYFDFSGYSDMAIGLAKMLGFTFPENFNNPYVSTSITDFWRRWHISLGTWMKHYLYIPLGGNQVDKKSRLYLNLWIVFLASGFWHGASWNFIIWGAYHGLFLILERMFLLNWLQKIYMPIRVLITFVIVLVGWVFFKMDAFKPAIQFIHQLFSFTQQKNVYVEPEFIGYLCIAAFFAFFTIFNIGKHIHQQFFKVQTTIGSHMLLFAMSTLLIFTSLCLITSLDFNPFIYFRF
jgi:alginate O-acetyltransferase complex protein AlgI